MNLLVTINKLPVWASKKRRKKKRFHFFFHVTKKVPIPRLESASLSPKSNPSYLLFIQIVTIFPEQSGIYNLCSTMMMK